MIDWHDLDQPPPFGTIALLCFGTAPQVQIGVWRGRDLWSFNGWWQAGQDLLVSLPIRRDPIAWATFNLPSSGGEPDAAPLTVPDAPVPASTRVSALKAAQSRQGARGREAGAYP